MASFERMHTIMNSFVAAFAICCICTAKAIPGHIDFSGLSYGGGGGGGVEYVSGGSPAPANLQLTGVPDESSYADLTFPVHNIQELGTSSSGSLPPQVVKVTKTITIKVPQPYEVQVPHPVPYPVPVAKPYPIPITKLVPVSHPVPVEVVKKIPVPIPISSSGGDYGGLGGGDYGHDQSGGYSAPDPTYENQELSEDVKEE